MSVSQQQALFETFYHKINGINDSEKLFNNKDHFAFESDVELSLSQYLIEEDTDNTNNEEMVNSKDDSEDKTIMIHHYKHRFCNKFDGLYSINENLIIDHLDNITEINYYCFCGQNFSCNSKKSFYKHLWKHGAKLYRCQKCHQNIDSIAEYESHLINVHQNKNLIAIKSILFDLYKMIKYWVDEYYTFIIERQPLFYSSFQSYCKMCQIYKKNYGLLMKNIQFNFSKDDTARTGPQMLDHQCKHLAYYRYVCLLCLHNYNLTKEYYKSLHKNQSIDNIQCTNYKNCLLVDDIDQYSSMYLTLPSKEFFTGHINDYHAINFSRFNIQEIIFKRWMNIEIFEREIRQLYSDIWNFDNEMPCYTKLDIINLLINETELKSKSTPSPRVRSKLKFQICKKNKIYNKLIQTISNNQNHFKQAMFTDFKNYLSNRINPLLEFISSSRLSNRLVKLMGGKKYLILFFVFNFDQ